MEEYLQSGGKVMTFRCAGITLAGLSIIWKSGSTVFAFASISVSVLSFSPFSSVLSFESCDDSVDGFLLFFSFPWSFSSYKKQGRDTRLFL